MSGCRAFIENDKIQYPDVQHCKDFNREVYAFLVDHPEIKTVILGRAWWDADETIGRTVSLIRELIAQGRKVILLAPPPIPGMNVEIAWATIQIQAGHAIDEMKLEGTPQVRQNLILEKLNRQLAAEIANGTVFLIDPARHFCDAKFCYLVRDGLMTFRDTGHLSEAAELQMEPDFRDALVRAGQGS